jgi:hypothetical protein
MVDVPLYVALTTAGAGIIGAMIPQVTSVIRDVRQAERDRRERSSVMTRDACVALLRAAGEVRTLTEKIRGYRGDADGMRTRVEGIRSHAEASARAISLGAPAVSVTPSYAVPRVPSSVMKVRSSQPRTHATGRSKSSATEAMISAQ